MVHAQEMPTSTIAPWKRKRPAAKPARKLTEAQKKEARARAAKAGRRYPNLVDNMAVSRKRKKSAPLRGTIAGKDA